jgi:hypothetical protein
MHWWKKQTTVFSCMDLDIHVTWRSFPIPLNCFHSQLKSFLIFTTDCTKFLYTRGKTVWLYDWTRDWMYFWIWPKSRAVMYFDHDHSFLANVIIRKHRKCELFHMDICKRDRRLLQLGISGTIVVSILLRNTIISRSFYVTWCSSSPDSGVLAFISGLSRKLIFKFA